MPKTNQRVNTAADRQRVRRMKVNEEVLREMFTASGISCVSLDKLLRVPPTEIVSLIAILKKLKIHNKNVVDLVERGCFRFESKVVEDDVNADLLTYLQEKYAGAKGMALKYMYDHRKDKFRKEIIQGNQDVFNNCLDKTAEKTIIRLFDSIDISDYVPPARVLEEMKPAPLPIIEPPIVQRPVAEPKVKATKVKATKVKATKVKATKVKATKVKALNAWDEAEAALTKNINVDKDDPNTEDVKEHKNAIKKIINDEMRAAVEDLLADEFDDFARDSIIEDFARRFRRTMPEKHKHFTLYQWTSRNPNALMKIIGKLYDGTVKAIQKEDSE